MADESNATEQSVKTVADLEKDDAGIVTRWLAEIAMADKASENFRNEAKEIWEIYEAEKAVNNSFAILWSNTETLAPAIYNSTPQPDVRRRFRDPDPVGKQAALVLERSLSYQIDDYDFDEEISDAALDMLLPGRGLARIVYEPHFATISKKGVMPAPAAGSFIPPPPEKPTDTEGSEPAETDDSYEKIVGQEARCEYVPWDKFRHGPGKRWKQVPWCSFEHEFTYDMCLEKFGKKMADALTFTDTAETETVKDEQARAVFKICIVQEIWDKDQRRVLFIAPSHKDRPCLVVPDPLRLRDFWCIPRPMFAIKNTRSLQPIPAYRMYKQQAEELNDTSTRINRIIKHLKIRGAYASGIPEAEKILDAKDGEMIAILNASLIEEVGGLDKLLWIMPIEKIAAALEYLYKARNEIKQAIFEISGVADIIRGATDPNETLGAQELKSQWGSLRIKRQQREVQRFIRDILRLKAEVIGQEFTIEQLKAMTGVQLPMQAEKDQAQSQMQAMQAQAAMQARQAQAGAFPADPNAPPPQAPQAPPPPQIPPEIEQMLKLPSWEQVKELLSSDQMRQYRVDIETDSTVSDTINQDMQGMATLVQQIGEVLAGVLKGLPMDVAKSIALSMCRRAKMGSAVEDALEALEQPPPQQAQEPPDLSVEVAKVNAENKLQITQIQEDNKRALAQSKAESDANIARIEQAAEAQRHQMTENMTSQREHLESRMQSEREHVSSRIDAAAVDNKAQLEAAVKVICANIAAKAGVDAATLKNAERETKEDVN